jgi:hypothetical protein
MSEPVASVAAPAASAAADPPDEPPGDRPRCHGLRVTPHSREWVKPAELNSGVVERACGIAPAASTRSTTG